VVARGSTGDVPRLVKVDRKTRLWVPTPWESDAMASHEQAMIEALRRIVKPGAVVYDIGAHVGLYAVALARMAGDRGHVYCVEADPVCVYLLACNMQLNGVANFDILPVAVLDGPGQTEFTINYRNFLVGVAAASPFGAKNGHRISVKADSLDGLIEGYGLRLPDLIKMDVEGAEVVAVLGRRRTLARCHPTI